MQNFKDLLGRKVNSATDKLKNKKRIYDLKRYLNDALEDKADTCDNRILQNIFNLIDDLENYAMTMKEIYKAIRQPPDRWRQKYRGLVLLEYLIRHGEEKVVHDAKKELAYISDLLDFQFIYQYRDVGSGIREKASFLYQLLCDDRFREAVRNDSKRTRSRIISFGNQNYSNANIFNRIASPSRPTTILPTRSETKVDRYGNGKNLDILSKSITPIHSNTSESSNLESTSSDTSDDDKISQYHQRNNPNSIHDKSGQHFGVINNPPQNAFPDADLISQSSPENNLNQIGYPSYESTPKQSKQRRNPFL